MLAIRLFNVIEDRRCDYKLSSPTYYTGLLESPLLRAQCFCHRLSRRPLHRVVPPVRGRCGLYAAIRGKVAICDLGLWYLWLENEAINSPSSVGNCLALVELLGRTIHHANGVARSSKQMILKLWIATQDIETDFALMATRLEAHYQCPVQLIKQRSWACIEDLIQSPADTSVWYPLVM